MKIITKMKQLRKLRGMKAKKICKKREKTIVNQREYNAETSFYLLKEFEKTLIKRKEFHDFKCPHFLIGSSQVFAFMKGDHSLKLAHASLATPFEAINIGKKGEDAFRKRHEIHTDHPFTISAQIPFICATPDFIVKISNEFILVEVKTHSSIENAKKMFDSVPLMTVMQVWIASDILKLDRIQIYIYFVTQKNTVNLYGIVSIRKFINFFNDNDLTTICYERYMEFMKFYLADNELKETHDFKLLQTHVLKSNKSPKTTTKNLNDSIFVRKMFYGCKKKYFPGITDYEQKDIEFKNININDSKPLHREIKFDITEQFVIKEEILKSSKIIFNNAQKRAKSEQKTKISESRLTSETTLKRKKKALLARQKEKIKIYSDASQLLLTELSKYKTHDQIKELLTSNRQRECVANLDQASYHSIVIPNDECTRRYAKVGVKDNRKKADIFESNSESSGNCSAKNLAIDFNIPNKRPDLFKPVIENKCHIIDEHQPIIDELKLEISKRIELEEKLSVKTRQLQNIEQRLKDQQILIGKLRNNNSKH